MCNDIPQLLGYRTYFIYGYKFNTTVFKLKLCHIQKNNQLDLHWISDARNVSPFTILHALWVGHVCLNNMNTSVFVNIRCASCNIFDLPVPAIPKNKHDVSTYVCKVLSILKFSSVVYLSLVLQSILPHAFELIHMSQLSFYLFGLERIQELLVHHIC